MRQTPPSPSTPWYRAAPVRLHDYDPGWPALYADDAKLLTDALAPDLVAIEHIGSTSVPGMAAKPVIDIIAAVADYGRFPSLVQRLGSVGYVYTPESEADDPDRRVFRKGPEDISQLRTHHLHLTTRGSRYWHRMIAFRDHLRRYPEDAAAYVDLKRGLAATHAADPAAYTAAKHDFVAAIEEKADPRRAHSSLVCPACVDRL
ncbi:MAG: GrpB family protein [Micromonospora sp.]